MLLLCTDLPVYYECYMSVAIKSTATVHKIQEKCISLPVLQRSMVVFEKLWCSPILLHCCKIMTQFHECIYVAMSLSFQYTEALSSLVAHLYIDWTRFIAMTTGLACSSLFASTCQLFLLSQKRTAEFVTATGEPDLTYIGVLQAFLKHQSSPAAKAN